MLGNLILALNNIMVRYLFKYELKKSFLNKQITLLYLFIINLLNLIILIFITVMASDQHFENRINDRIFINF